MTLLLVLEAVARVYGVFIVTEVRGVVFVIGSKKQHRKYWA